MPRKKAKRRRAKIKSYWVGHGPQGHVIIPLKRGEYPPAGQQEFRTLAAARRDVAYRRTISKFLPAPLPPVVRKTIKERWLAGEVVVEQRFEGDRMHLGIRQVDTGEQLCGWWDYDVSLLMEAGVLKSGRVPGSEIDEESVIDYAEYLRIPVYVV